MLCPEMLNTPNCHPQKIGIVIGNDWQIKNHLMLPSVEAFDFLLIANMGSIKPYAVTFNMGSKPDTGHFD